MRGLAILAMVVGVLLLGVGGVGAVRYLNPEGGLPASYRSLPDTSPTKRDYLRALRRSAAAQTFLAGMGGAILLLLGANLLVLVQVREEIRSS
ncbi:MAG: hypothetical protein ACK4G4_12145 [Thermus sp.]|uniref:hypothetical protein n=1 Tax=Thermus sp. TaxID=275 RepID=UPI00391A83A0